MTIGRKFFLGIIVVLALLIAVTAVADYSLDRVRSQYGRLFDENLRLAEGSDTLALRIRDQILLFRGTLLYPERAAEYGRQLEESRAQFQAVADDMTRLVDTARERSLLDELIREQAALDAAQDRALALLAEGDEDAALAVGDAEAAPEAAAALELASEFRRLQDEGVADGRREAAATARNLMILMLVLSAAAVLIGLAVAFYLARSITEQLRTGIMRLTSAAAQILATTAEVASGTAETATAVNETTATVEEVKQTVQMASDKARHVSESAQEMTQVAQRGRDSIEDTIDAMREIQAQMESVADSIVQLAEQSQAIGEIIATVNDLAEQSNLLAVNAAIEATRAGEQGKGFAVVAQEVRSLAAQSKQATSQVRGILGDVQKATNAAVLATEQGSKVVDGGVRQTESTSDAINRLADSVTAAAQAATQIAASNQQQMVGMDQVALAMDNIKEASSQNVAGTRQAETAAQDLQELGRQLARLVTPRGV